MLRNLRERMSDEQGFTLIELLVVILIIGILAAIALPAFLGQQQKGQDADAKSNARNLVSQVESCFATEQDYQKCDDELTNTGLTLGSDPGEVEAVASSATAYKVTAYSKAKTGTANHEFEIDKSGLGSGSQRNCTPTGQGGCPTTGKW